MVQRVEWLAASFKKSWEVTWYDDLVLCLPGGASLLSGCTVVFDGQSSDRPKVDRPIK